jgi:hypothetical protein
VFVARRIRQREGSEHDGAVGPLFISKYIYFLMLYIQKAIRNSKIVQSSAEAVQLVQRSVQ